MFDYITLENCPELYALNCKNYMVKCNSCKAFSKKNKYLKYVPIDKSISNHPINNKQKKTTSYSRKGRVLENKLIKNNPFLQSTYLSGSLNGDGDAYINISNKIPKIRVEIKSRFTKRGSIFPTKKEYQDGINQNISLIVILHNYLSDRAYLSINLFMDILNTLIGCPKLNIEVINSTSNLYKYTVINFKGINKGFYFLIKDCVKKEVICDSGKINIYKDNDKLYAAMNLNLFNELIDIYKQVLEIV